MDAEPTFLSVVPPLLAIAAALLFHRVILALSVGVLLGAFVVHGFSVPDALMRTIDTYLVGALLDGGHQWILAFALCLGALMRVITESGGSLGMARSVTRYARTARSGQLTAWGLGILFFFDDYANTLFVGSSMGPVTDRLRISREKLAFIVDATAAPVASLAPISSWIAVELGYIADQLRALHIERDAYLIFLQTLPIRFYPLFMLALGLMIAASGRDFGPMAAAERRAREAEPGATRSFRAAPSGLAVESHWALAAVPIGIVVVSVVIGLYWTGRQSTLEQGLPLSASNILTNASSSKAMVWASLLGGALATALAAGRRSLGPRGALLAYLRGAVHMAPVMLVLLLAWSLGAVCKDLKTAEYLVRVLGSGFAPGLLPALVFMVSALVSFATGTSWGTMGIVFPLAMPLAHQMAPGNEGVLLGTLSSVLAGSVLGDHCSPISDTTIMSALATDCDQLQHVKTQLPYALLAGAVSVVFGSLPVGMGWLPGWVSLLLGAAVLWFALGALSRASNEPVPPPRGRE